MLIYFGTGERRYGEKPLHAYQRRAWEFQVVLKGKIAPALPSGAQSAQGRRLWIFPPGHSHGWIGEKNRSAQIAVFHFLSAPALLTQLFNPRGFLEIALTPGQIHQIKALSSQVAQYWNQPAPGMMICYEHALMELSLIACEVCAAHTVGSQSNYPQSRVNAAIRWYAERMETNPAFTQVARAVGVSAAHLRRLFHEVLRVSPNQIMDQLRFQRAMQLMSDPALKLEVIGHQCGFGSASIFSRAFKTKFGSSPQSWRSANSPQPTVATSRPGLSGG